MSKVWVYNHSKVISPVFFFFAANLETVFLINSDCADVLLADVQT